jgi:hypothetical protein
MAGPVAAFLSLTLLAFFFLTGFSLLHLLGMRRNLLKRALLAPSAGAAILVLILFTISHLNYPVRRFAVLLGILFIAGCAIVLWRCKPILPVRQLKPFLIVLVAAFLLTGYPLLLYGFNWVSYANSDMAGYVLAAQRFADHGFYDLPDQHALTENRDAGDNYWFTYAIEGPRAGSDLLLAWVISITGLTGFQVYMPVLLALHVGLISALGAMVLSRRGLRIAALTCCAWLAVSSLNTLGTLYQLMPQVFGIMLLIASGTLLLEPFRPTSRRESVRLGILIGIPLTALLIVYYEILPFLVVAFGAYHILQTVRKAENIKWAVVPISTAVALAAISLRTWALSAALFLGYQAGRSLTGQNVEMSIFPYYLVPSGLANLWGFAAIGAQTSGMALNVGIIAGAVLLLAAALASVWQAWRGEPAAIFSLVMLSIGARLFVGNGDFGLFKLAMYIQPFLLAAFILAWHQLSNRWVS